MQALSCAPCVVLPSCYCRRAPVLSQLTVNGKNEGPHVFIVHLRDANGNFMPGAHEGSGGSGR